MKKANIKNLDRSPHKITYRKRLNIDFDFSELSGLTRDGIWNVLESKRQSAITKNACQDEPTFHFEQDYDYVDCYIMGTVIETDAEFAERQRRIVESQTAQDKYKAKRIEKLKQEAAALGMTVTEPQ